MHYFKFIHSLFLSKATEIVPFLLIFSWIITALTVLLLSGKMNLQKDRASATDGNVEYHRETEADNMPTVWAVLLDAIKLSFYLF